MSDQKKLVVFGSLSAIAKSCCRLYAARGYQIVLLARNLEGMQEQKYDLMARGAAAVDCHAFDAQIKTDALVSLVDSIFESKVDILVTAYGTLPDQKKCEKDLDAAMEAININAISVISLLTLAANKMESQGEGHIAVITSVAGDRGRQSNYYYGASKGMLSTFLEGLSHRLCKQGVNVIDIKPGFVDTPMTKDFDKGPLWVRAEVVAERIVKSIDKKKDVVYVPWFWWAIMMIIRNLPVIVFNRLRI